MNKKITAALLCVALCLCALSAQALTVTGRETETLERIWAANKFFARMEALTGIAVEPAGVTQEEEYAEMLDQMMKGDVRTDVLFKADLSREQETALLESGAIIDLSAMIDAHMPNLSALLAKHPEWRDVITLEDGRIATLPLLNEKERQACLWINSAWLEKLGMAMPANLAQLTDALLAMQDGDLNGNGKADEIGAELIGVYEMRWLLPYFGVVADDYHLARGADGQIVFAPELPVYREFVALLKDWHDRGVLADDAFTRVHASVLLNAGDEEQPVTSGMLLAVTPYTQMNPKAVTDYEPLLLAGPDGVTRWRDLLGGVWTGCFAVTSRCEDPAQALRWVDALYAEEGAILGYAGVEGEDYTVSDAGAWTFNVEGNSDINALRSEVFMYTGTAMPGIYPADFIHRVDSELDRHVFEASEKARAVSERVTQAYCLSAKDQARANELVAEIGRIVDEGIARFATGEIELSDENYDAWLAQLKEAGSEELTTLFKGK
ncbi:MAG: extracellular solute-binding protein [Clostridiales bacterium]|nr:extracellular solute-binding protein [Clostridiales bacterium]